MLGALSFSPTTFAQTPAPPAKPAAPVTGRATAKVQIARWLDLQNATLNLRYRVADNSAGLITTNQIQHRESLRGRIKADRAGRYALNFGLFTGARFTSGWDNTPIGGSAAQKNLAFKQLFVAAQPVAGFEGQIGGLYLIRGESSELTTYDEDGYVMGERVSVRRPHEVFFDELSFTNAHLTADARRIAVNTRFHYMDQPNYRHLLADKKIGTRAGVSVDFTTHSGARTWREAINIKTPEARYIDALLVETYQRTHPDRKGGLALSANKAITNKLSVNGGYASIDPGFGGLNADRFNIGNRVFLTTAYVFSPQFTVSYFITTGVGHNASLPQRTLSNLVFAYNALIDLRRTGLF